jgi:hypothetical protein
MLKKSLKESLKKSNKRSGAFLYTREKMIMTINNCNSSGMKKGRGGRGGKEDAYKRQND